MCRYATLPYADNSTARALPPRKIAATAAVLTLTLVAAVAAALRARSIDFDQGLPSLLIADCVTVGNLVIIASFRRRLPLLVLVLASVVAVPVLAYTAYGFGIVLLFRLGLLGWPAGCP